MPLTLPRITYNLTWISTTYAVSPVQVRIDAAGKEHLMPETYGYVRVSTKEQNEDRQMIAMQEANVPEKISTWTSSPGKTSTTHIL